MDKPRFQHDCDHCVFLGYSIGYDKPVDVYWCKHRSVPNLDSILGRFGNEGSEYISCNPPEAIGGTHKDREYHYNIPEYEWYRFALKEAFERKLYLNPSGLVKA